MDGKIEELKKEKRTLATSITKVLNELAAELSTKTPNKEDVTQNYRTSNSDGMNCWSCWTCFKPCMEKISMHCWQLQQVMKRIK